MSDAAAAAAAAVLDDFVGTSDAAETQVSEQPAPEPEAVQVPELPDFTPDLSGIEDLLDEPEPDLSVDEEEEPELEQLGEYDDDPDVTKLKARLAKAEKQNKYLADLRSKESLKNWRAEAARRFPYSDPDTLAGNSRRAVLRQALDQHQRVEKKVKPLTDVIESLKTRTIEEAKAEAKAEAARAYGQPTSGPGLAQVEASEHAEAQNTRKPGGNFYDSVRDRFKNGMQI